MELYFKQGLPSSPQLLMLAKFLIRQARLLGFLKVPQQPRRRPCAKILPQPAPKSNRFRVMVRIIVHEDLKLIEPN